MNIRELKIRSALFSQLNLLKIQVAFLFLFFININCKAEIYNLGQKPIDSTKIHRIDKFDNILKGSPYFLNSWFSDSEMYLNYSKIVADLAFNVYTNKLLFSKGDFQESVLIKPDSFNLAGYVFVKLDSKIKPKNNNYFQKIFSTERLQLLKQYTCDYFEKNGSRKLGYENDKDSYVGYYTKKAKYYILIDYKVFEIDNKFSKKTGANKMNIGNFISQNRINLSNENDVLSLVNYYISII